MAGTNILKEFLVKIGFKVDEAQFRNFQESLKRTAQGASEVAKEFVKVGAATTAGLTASALVVHKFSQSLTALYYSAQRTGASAKELKVLEYGFEQIGLTADDARGSVEALASARRNNPGTNGLLASFGIDPSQVDNAKVLVALLEKLRSMPKELRGRYGDVFGLNEGVINQVALNNSEMISAMQRREQFFKTSGYDPDKASIEAVKLTRAWNEASMVYQTMFEQMAVRLLPVAERFIDVLEGIADWLGKTDKATGGWVTKLGALGIVLMPILTALKVAGAGTLFTKGAGLLFRGGAAAGAGGAAAAEGGAGLLGFVGWPLLIAAAVAAALVWMGSHPEQVRKAAGAAWDWTKKAAGAIGGEIKAGVQAAQGAAKSSGGYLKALSLQPGVIGDLARLVGRFEGFRDHVYNDIAGKATYGYGHKVKAGENMAGVDPVSLFMSDLKQSLAAVARYVKVKLTDNQRKALADLEYNIGAGAFAKSTLVRKLNSGDVSGASNEFARWNKVLVNGHYAANDSLSRRRASEAQLFRTPDNKNLNLHTTITVEGADNPRETAREVGREQKRTYADIVRNFAPAYQ